MLFSILIPTLHERAEMLKVLMTFLEKQINGSGDVEILTFPDSRGQSKTGSKRNMLLKRAQGRFSAFVDDDDWVSDNYVSSILRAIYQVHDLDCVGFWGNVFFSGNPGGRMIHSLACPCWRQKGDVFFRPPNHLNPIRTEKARSVPFRDITISEDHFWSNDMTRKSILKNEVFIGEDPMYIYRCGGHERGL
ncbi:MAG: glycosyltransferase family A protein [Methanosarcinales archaeon]